MDPHVCVIVVEAAVLNIEVLEGEARFVYAKDVLFGHDDHFLVSIPLGQLLLLF